MALPETWIERPEGFVKKEEGTPGGKRTGECDPLALAARHFAWLAGGKPAHAHRRQCFIHTFSLVRREPQGGLDP